MALIDCPDCGHEVSSSAASCPNCGYPINVEGADLVRALQARQATVEERAPRWDWARIVNFRSRTRRVEFWAVVAIVFAVGIGVEVVRIYSSEIVGALAYLAWIVVAIWPGLGVQVNRLHDMGYSGWLLLVSIVPLVGFGMLIWMGVQTGRPRSNQWGPPVA